MYVRTFNCTTIGYVRLHASIAGKQAQLVRFSRITKIYFSWEVVLVFWIMNNMFLLQEMMYMIMKIIIVQLSGSMV